MKNVINNNTLFNSYTTHDIGAVSTSNRKALYRRAYYRNYDTATTSSLNEINILDNTGVPTANTVELQIWYSSDDSNYVKPTNVTDDSTIQQWLDKSNYSHNLNGQGNNKPTYQTDPSLNNLSIIQFANSSYFSINPIEWFNNLTSFSYFVLYKTSNITISQNLSSTNTNSLSINLNMNNINVYFDNVSGTINNAIDDNWHLFTMIYDGTQTTNNDKLKVKIDKTYKTINFSGTITNSTGTNNSHIYIGRDYTGNSGFFEGYIAELILYNVSLSNDNISLIEDYVYTKWNL